MHMNRVILIGNGFDLAHGIKTGYHDFISNYWQEIINKLKEMVSGNLTMHTELFETNEIEIKNVPGAYPSGNWVYGNTFQDLENLLKSHNLKLNFKNQLLKILSKKHIETKWVDIENEYYDLLKSSFKDNPSTYNITKLNIELNGIQKLLEKYLINVEADFFEKFGSYEDDIKLKNEIAYKIYSPFNLIDFTEAAINERVENEYRKIKVAIEGLKDEQISLLDLDENTQNLISIVGINVTEKEFRKKLISNNTLSYFETVPEEILFLNFNYTFIEKIYSNKYDFAVSQNLKNSIIHIHGTTNKNDHNNIIFGFGDEMDEDYKSIENLNNNEYLENIKSIKYLETDNYKQLLEFLNGGKYQIFIFGHSCGISDRTLLNTLFEHNNCLSIKPFYHQLNLETDNYSDIVRNISRNFNSKTNMRDKVVNKKYCEPLS